MEDCIRCKGKDPSICGRTYCPLLARVQARRIEAKQDFTAQSPTIFVGRHGYPDVNVGFLGVEQYEDHDEPKKWVEKGYDIEKISQLRTSLINSSFKASVKGFSERLAQMSQEVGMAQEPVELEINLSKKPSYSLNFDQSATPHGPNVRLIKARITQNPKVPTIVEKTVSDTDLKASQALTKLSSRLDEHYLARLLSAGTLGQANQRKLVPTRWSITAVDDTVSKALADKIQDYQTSERAVHYASYLGNHFIILLEPRGWSFELLENWQGTIMQDYEYSVGRRAYADNTTGGYYATRLAVLEHLDKTKQKACAIALRVITSDYYAPLGVWVVREAARKALASSPMIFENRELALNYVKAIAKKRLNLDAGAMISKSALLSQTSLERFGAQSI